MKDNPINIKQLISNEKITMYYQPIVSPKNSKLIGFEALVRGIDSRGDLINPFTLFEMAKSQDMVSELDHLCIKSAIKGFTSLYHKYNHIFLFINIDVTVLDEYNNSDFIINNVNECNIPTTCIILEINELASVSLEPIKYFSNKYKGLGFNISLDDVGAGSSNLDRIPLIEPDIIKIDKDLIFGIHNSFYKQQVVTMLIRLASSTGALVVAEGAEDINDIMFVLEKGAQFLQGFYISRPVELSAELYTHSMTITKTISKIHQLHISQITNKRRTNNDFIKNTGSVIIDRIAKYSAVHFEQALENIIKSSASIESAYIIDEDGFLITNTLFSNIYDDKIHTRLHSPAIKGESVQLEPYYYNLASDDHVHYISEPYISMASGNRCITMSSYFYDLCIKRYILCIDFVS